MFQLSQRRSLFRQNVFVLYEKYPFILVMFRVCIKNTAPFPTTKDTSYVLFVFVKGSTNSGRKRETSVILNIKCVCNVCKVHVIGYEYP